MSPSLKSKREKRTMTQDELFTIFHDIGIVPVVKIDDASKAEALAKALIDGGLPCAEVTFRTAAAEEAIRRMSKAHPEMLIGAGTVINPELAEKAVAAGAKFIVSPGLNPATVEWCLAHDVPVVPGIATPSEIEKGLSYGLKVLKFFPSEALGGVNMLKNLAGPFPQVKFMTTGGINAGNLAEYAKAKNVLAIGGSWMVKADLIQNDQWDKITALCREAVINLQGLEFAHMGINGASEDDAASIRDGFQRFGLPSSSCGNISYFINKDIEIMRVKGRGTRGHIGYRCYDLERTVHFLKANGFTPDMDSAKYENGRLKLIYFKEEIGGFALHLVK